MQTITEPQPPHGTFRLVTLSRAPIAAFWAIGVVWGSFMAALPDVKAGLGVSDGEMGVLLLWASVAAIASMLANQFGEADGIQVSALMYAALILMLLTFAVNVLAQWVVRRLSLRY